MYEKAKREAKLELLRRAEEGMDFEFDESMFAERETHEPKKNEAKKPGLLSQLFGSAGKAEKKGKKNDVKSRPKSTKPESKTKSASKSAVVSAKHYEIENDFGIRGEEHEISSEKSIRGDGHEISREESFKRGPKKIQQGFKKTMK
ncbi:unnamed protein product [Heligmosomoides polygyrus]|uniref:NUC153 domain-containing protein n=1 Tax=Heligmosomoides polygyrus TaxID=6339 RepID=A0A183F9Z9_HELPZ|nr:unnamed protein product [Heligmosomoides polygyrus]